MKDNVRIEVNAFKIDDTVIWKPKTRQSYGKVHLRETARSTAVRILARKSYLLFPNDPALHRGVKTNWKSTETTEANLMLWRIQSWIVPIQALKP